VDYAYEYVTLKTALVAQETHADENETLKAAIAAHDFHTDPMLAALSTVKVSQTQHLTAELLCYCVKVSSVNADKCQTLEAALAAHDNHTVVDYADENETLKAAIAAHEFHTDPMLAVLSTAKVSQTQHLTAELWRICVKVSSENADKYQTLVTALAAHDNHTVVDYADEYETLKAAVAAHEFHTDPMLAVLSTTEVSQTQHLTAELRRTCVKVSSENAVKYKTLVTVLAAHDKHTVVDYADEYETLQAALAAQNIHVDDMMAELSTVEVGPHSPFALPPELTFDDILAQAEPVTSKERIWNILDVFLSMVVRKLAMLRQLRLRFMSVLMLIVDSFTGTAKSHAWTSVFMFITLLVSGFIMNSLEPLPWEYMLFFLVFAILDVDRTGM